jgi:hypothetical protein
LYILINLFIIEIIKIVPITTGGRVISTIGAKVISTIGAEYQHHRGRVSAP